MRLPRILYLEFNNLLTLVLNSNICLLMKLSVVIFTGMFIQRMSVRR